MIYVVVHARSNANLSTATITYRLHTCGQKLKTILSFSPRGCGMLASQLTCQGVEGGQMKLLVVFSQEDCCDFQLQKFYERASK